MENKKTKNNKSKMVVSDIQSIVQEYSGSIQRNVYRKHIIKKVFELVLLALLIGAGSASAYASSITAENVKTQINYQREIRGLSPLKEDQRLDEAASAKSNDMVNRDYFEHYAYGLTPWLFISDQDYNYLYAGENLAMDFETSEGMVRAWMSSPSHRKNILNADFEDIGIGIVKGEYTDDTGTHETTMVTNMFGKEKPKILQYIDTVVNAIKNLF